MTYSSLWAKYTKYTLDSVNKFVPNIMAGVFQTILLNNRPPYRKKNGICGLTGWCWRTRKPANIPSPPWWLWKAWLRWGALAGGGRGPWKRSRPLRWGPWNLTGGPRPRSKSWKIQPPNWPFAPTVSHPKLWPRTSSRIWTPLEKVNVNTNC